MEKNDQEFLLLKHSCCYYYMLSQSVLKVLGPKIWKLLPGNIKSETSSIIFFNHVFFPAMPTDLFAFAWTPRLYVF